MLRYNHSLVERKWMELIEEQKQAQPGAPRICTVLVPGDSAEIELENARLVVLADFFAALRWPEGWVHEVCGGTEDLPRAALRLGTAPALTRTQPGFQLGVVPRDYQHLIRAVDCRETLYVGRFLGGLALDDLLLDFGGDALRIFFLFQGPPERDYQFNWYGLVSAHRFVQRVWRLAQNLTEAAWHPWSESSLLELAALVQKRSTAGKPHTALAALMAYLKQKTALSPGEVRAVAELLRPFAPFLSAELTSMAPVEHDDHRQCDQADG